MTIGVGMTIRVYSRGLSASVESGERSSLPLVLAVILAVVAIVIVNPLICGPLIVTCFFLPGIFSDWLVGTTLGVAVVGYGLSATRLWI